jgi:hypothetical protein
MTDRQERQRRLDRARTLGRFELFVAFTAMPLALFLLVAAPGHMGGGMFAEPTLMESLMPWAGAAVYVFSVAWMIRIHRANPEAGERSWRYHDL